MSATEKLKKKLLTQKPLPKSLPGLSTGSVLLNLACTGLPDVGIYPSYYYLLVGDSQAGKTWLSRQILAEASINPDYDKYRLICNNPERGSLMDIRRFFGHKLADRMESPKGGNSTTIQGFYDHLEEMVEEGEPFIEVLDSEDALDDEAEVAKAKKNRNIRRKQGTTEVEEGEEEGKNKLKGSYGGVGKAKVNSNRLRTSYNGLEEQGSILVIIKQTRDNIGPDAMFRPKTKSGGRALTFYATLELWFSIAGKLTRTVNGKSREIGSTLKIKVVKNRVAGRHRTIDLHFYPSFGIDDVGSCVSWLIEEEKWEKVKQTIHAKELNLQGTEESLIQKIEEKGLEKELYSLVAETWQDIEEACEVKRKRRYD